MKKILVSALLVISLLTMTGCRSKVDTTGGTPVVSDVPASEVDNIPVDQLSDETISQTTTGSPNTNGCAPTSFTALKGEGLTIEPSELIQSYATFNDTYGTYRAIFTNYPIADDTDFKVLASGQKKLVVMLIGNPGEQFSPGNYNFQTSVDNQTDRSFTLSLATDAGEKMATAVNGADIGSVQITKVDEKMICGTMGVADSNGLEVKGNFTVLVK